MLEQMLKSHRVQEIMLSEKADYLRKLIRIETDRNNALGIIYKEGTKRSINSYRPLEERLTELQKIYEIKERHLDLDTAKLRQRFRELQGQIDALEMHENDQPSWAPDDSQEKSMDKRYSDVNSLIESLSLEASRYEK